MPPWHATPAPGFPEFRDSSPSGRLRYRHAQGMGGRGHAGGRPDESAAPPVFAEGWALGAPDVEIAYPGADRRSCRRSGHLSQRRPSARSRRRRLGDRGRLRAERAHGRPPRAVLRGARRHVQTWRRQRRRCSAFAPADAEPGRMGAGHDAEVLPRRHRATVARAHEPRHPASPASVGKSGARTREDGDLPDEATAGRSGSTRFRCRRCSASRTASTFRRPKSATPSRTRSCFRSTSTRLARADTRTISRTT